MVKINCSGKTANDCYKCNRYNSAHSSHYDKYYNCRVVEISCGVGGNRIFKDEDDDTHRIS